MYREKHWKVEFCGFGFLVMKPVKLALHVRICLLRGFSFPCWNILIKQCKTNCGRLHACFWHVCSGKSHTCAPLRYKRSEGQHFLRTDVSCSFWSQLVEKLMMKGCKGERWIPEYRITYLVLQLKLYLLFCTMQNIFVPAKLYRQFEYGTVNMMQRCRTRQVLCLRVPLALGFSPGVHLQNDGEPLGRESVCGSLVWLWGPACPHLSLLRKQKDLDTRWVKQDLKKLFCHSQWTLKIVHGKQLYRLLKCKKLTENLLWTF